MLNLSACPAMSTSVLKALPGKLDIKRHSPSILYLWVNFKKQCKVNYLNQSINGNFIHIVNIDFPDFSRNAANFPNILRAPAPFPKRGVRALISWDLSCEPNIYLSWSTSEIRVRLVPSNMFKSSINFLTDRSKAVLLLWILFVICVLCHTILSGFLQPYGDLLGKGWPLGSLVCDVSCVCVTFAYGVLGQVWYLIVWIPDLCLLPYFAVCLQNINNVNFKWSMVFRY